MIDFGDLAAAQRRLLKEFEELHGGKAAALKSENSADFFRAVFASDFTTAESTIGKEKGNNEK